MADQKFIRIVNWERFQHYKDRNPPWIKLHREILTSRTWATTNDASRVLAIALMMLAAATGNKIPFDRAYIRRVAYLNQDPDFSELFEAQFIELMQDPQAAAVLAPASNLHTIARPETEAEAETETEKKEPCATNTAPTSSSTKKHACQMPENFHPTDAHARLACELEVNLETALQAFTDFHLSKGNTFKDWDRAFNTWLRNEKKFTRRIGNGNGNGNRAQQRQADNLAALDLAFPLAR